MSNRGRIIAMDPHAGRLGLLSQAASRLGVSIVETHAGGVAAVSGRWKGRCDRVLVDAPCSNLGVLRRNPDVKWKREEAELGRLAEKQRGILAAAAALARPGGRLVYATCSLEPEENDAVVGGFLTRHTDFRVEAPTSFPLSADVGGFVQMRPDALGTDGFTAVRLRRA
jgi:16S rRNA (cytosine967-C5)-methyltransferase